MRDDLEFYLPQLCCMFLKGNMPKDMEENFTEFIILASQSSFFFAHRVYFFFNSNIVNDDPDASEISNDMKKQIELLLKL